MINQSTLSKLSRSHWFFNDIVVFVLFIITVISNDPKHLRSWFRVLPQQLIAVCDGDAAGRRLAKYGRSGVIHMPDGADVGSVSQTEFNQMFAQWM